MTVNPESAVAINWSTKKKIIVNPEKVQAIALDKKKSDNSRQPLNINNQQTKTVSPVEPLGIQLDDRLNFKNHTNNICRSAANEVNCGSTKHSH